MREKGIKPSKGNVLYSSPVLNKMLDEDKSRDPESVVYFMLHVKHGYFYSLNALK